MTESNYPDVFIRGVSRDNAEFITEEGYVTQAAFAFDDYDAESRNDDGFRELSINWLDDDGAIQTLLNQVNQRKGGPQFQGGYCRISRYALLSLQDYINNGHLSYERRPIHADVEKGIPENPYHGNLLMQKDISNKSRTNLQIALAVLAGNVIRRQS